MQSTFIPLPTKKCTSTPNKRIKSDLWGMVLSSFKREKEVANKASNDIESCVLSNTKNYEFPENDIIELLHLDDSKSFEMINDTNFIIQTINLQELFKKEMTNPSDAPIIKNDVNKIRNKKKPLNVIIAGAPASGKGTQCERIKEMYGLVHLSTGDMLREAVKLETDIGKIAKKFMDQGELVPDELIINLVKERIQEKDCKEKGWLLDGFPRTKAQAESLTTLGIQPDCFLHLRVPDSQIIKRVTGRRIDATTGKIYHLLYNPPPTTSSKIIQRSDDTEEKIITRLEQFHDNFDSVRECYEDVMVEIDGDRGADVVYECIVHALDQSYDRISLSA